MKKTLLLTVAAFLFAGQGLGQGYQGNLDGVSCQNISGWATGQYLFPAYIDIYDGATIVQPNVPANSYRGDLGNSWGFSIAPPAALLDHRLHQVYAKFSGTQVNVGSTPKAMQCASSSQGYTYLSQPSFGDPGNWTSNGTVSTAGNIFSSSSEGSWISITGVPDGTSNYEVKTILSLKQSGGTYIQYLRATSNAMTGFGTAIQVALSDPQFSGGGCTASLTVNDLNNGSSSQDGQWTVPCADGMEMRTVVLPQITGPSQVGIMVGGTEYWAASNITSGLPGIGARGTPSGYLIVRDNAVIGDSYSADYTDTTVAVAYDTAYIRNRVLARTVTPASGSATVTTNTYDQYPNLYPYNGLTNDAPNLQQHDSTMDTSYKTRGNVTNVAVTVNGLNVTSTNTDYDIQGNAIATSDSLGHYNTITVDSYGNVPQSALPNGNGNLSTSFSFNSFFAPTSVSQPSNGTTASATYDTYGRPSTTTSPGGAVTKYYYCPMVTSDNDSCDKVGFTLPATRTGLNYTRITVVNSRWSRDQYDGLGRVIRTDRGDTSGNVVSMVDTDYDSCACSPTGKMKQTSLPYKPGAAVYWTVYTYDGLGRTLSVRAPDGASTTSYAYYGNTTVVTDPAQKWKAMTSDVNGNLTSVIEPDPSQGTVSAPGSVQSPNCGSAPLTGSTQLTGLPAQTLGTCYYYDAFNNLTGVDLYRSNYNQVRTFTYQPGTNWLLTATNPENGKVTYTRDSAGRVLTRVDAAQQTTSYTYDAYNRLTKVDRGSNACGTDNYYYDQPIPGRNDGFSSGYSWGKLTAVSFGNASGGACPGSDPVNSTTWGGVIYEYAYSQAGQVTGKRMAVTRGYQGTNYTANLDTFWNYDGEGRVIQLTYPSHIDSYTGNPVTTTYQYSYDALGRPQNLNNVTPQPDQIAIQASVSQYNENDQILSWSYGSNWNYWGFQGGAITEGRQYNQMFQLTGIAATWENNNGTQQAFSENYIYSGNQNNGQITDVCANGIWNQQASTCSGEKVHYQYDQLKRLTAANSTAGWSQTYNYDGFGNMTWKNPGFNVLMDVTTNRVMGFNYDTNGNLALGNWSYDAENRLVRVDSGGGEYYAYDPSNKRVYRQNENSGGGGDTYYLYGVDGQKLGEYTAGIGCAPGYNNWPCPYVLSMTVVGESVYFAGKKVGSYLPHDRLGSVRGNASGANRPYGENYTQGGDGFATYTQDSSTGLNYADQRYYAATYGRFMTADRYKVLAKSPDSVGDPSTPTSSNPYSYVGNDPANYVDPTGNIRCDPTDPGCDPFCPDPSAPSCQGSDPGGPTCCAPPPPPTPIRHPSCSLKLEYRQAALTGRSHSSLVVTDGYGFTFTMQGQPQNYPSPQGVPPTWGNLVVSNTPGNIGDHQWGPTLTSSTDSKLCYQINQIEAAENFYSNHPVTYYPWGPNSNSLVSWLLQSGFVDQYFTAPPKTTGWDTPLYGSTN